MPLPTTNAEPKQSGDLFTAEELTMQNTVIDTIAKVFNGEIVIPGFTIPTALLREATAGELTALAQAITPQLDARYAQLGAAVATLTNFTFANPVLTPKQGTATTYTLLGTYSNGTTATINGGITWATNSGFSIAGGVLTLPATAPVGNVVQLTATVGGLQKSISVTIQAAGATEFPARRYDMGAPSTGSTYNGVAFLNDSEIHELPSGNTPTNYGNPIANANFQAAYQSLRFGSSPYRALFNNVPDGNYTLHWHTFGTNVNNRVTSSINGVDKDVNMITVEAAGGQDSALVRSYDFTVSGGGGSVVFGLIALEDIWVVSVLELVAQGVPPTLL